MGDGSLSAVNLKWQEKPLAAVGAHVQNLAYFPTMESDLVFWYP